MLGEAANTKDELDRLLAGIHGRYGYDFRHYSKNSLKRRIDRSLCESKLTRYGDLLDHLLRDEKNFAVFLKNLSISVTEMFRDLEFYRAIRTKIIPVLKTYPFIKIWHAGCATGEEAYSMALLLHEEGFLNRAQIYATDFNKTSLEAAASGIYPARRMGLYADNYKASGGQANFSGYYFEKYELAMLKDFLKDRVTFSYHNLVTDGVFGEMNLILCRNVLIYFDRVLQDQVLCKFAQSLCHSGFLCLGAKETLNFTQVNHAFQDVDKAQRIYRKSAGDYRYSTH